MSVKSKEPYRSLLLPFATAALAVAIFALDTVTSLEIAASALYVSVVLLADRFCDRKRVILVTAGCMLLTALSFLLSGGGSKQAGQINTAISLLAIGATAFLVLEAQSAKSNVRLLAESEQLRNALFGSVSHELKTPVAAILGGISVLAETDAIKNDPRLLSLTSGISDEANRLNNDIQNLLDAARITSQGLLSRIDWSDPADVVSAAVDRISRRHSGRAIQLKVPKNLPLVHIDPVLIEQALGQILGNAVKFSPVNSVVHVDAFAEDGQVVIRVRDEGLGITSEEREKLFEPFFRGGRHINTLPGSGLGMWIANTFVKNSGGAILATSDGKDRGATIRVVFPASDGVYEEDVSGATNLS